MHMRGASGRGTHKGEGMIKRDELERGCMSRARENEMTFVLLGRDAAAPVAIRAWAWERVRIGKNSPTDDQIIEALSCAETMERERLAGAAPSEQEC